MYTEGSGLMEKVMGRQFAETQRHFYTAFQTALPDLGAVEIGWRLGCVVGIIVYLFAGVEVRGMASLIGIDPQENLARLLSVTVPLMTAPAMEVVS
jgi:hypothetical protein